MTIRCTTKYSRS